MAYTADLHVHSPFSIGTSKNLSLESLASWARTKGIDLLATGDFTHPQWLEEIGRKLRDTGDGLMELGAVRFVPGTEVNCNAPQGGRNRRTHMLVLAPGLATARRIAAALASFGSIGGDGRPTLHITPRDLVATLLELDPDCLFIPAHIWTPWFGMYGSKSGFDSLEECFGDMTSAISGVETGLSSEPAMNWRVPDLDGVSIVSFSDAHSAPRLGREATVLNGELSYDGLARALRTQDIACTIELYPEAGKYHYSGHSKCGVSLSPAQVAEIGPRCPECGRPMTLGVLQRVQALATRKVETWRDDAGLIHGGNGRPPFRMLVPLQQILSESLGVGPNTKTVARVYETLVGHFGTELAVLTEAQTAEIEAVADDRVALAVDLVRGGDLLIEPGFDGQYGRVNVRG